MKSFLIEIVLSCHQSCPVTSCGPVTVLSLRLVLWLVLSQSVIVCHTLSTGSVTVCRLVLSQSVDWFCHSLSTGSVTVCPLVLSQSVDWFCHTLSQSVDWFCHSLFCHPPETDINPHIFLNLDQIWRLQPRSPVFGFRISIYYFILLKSYWM